MSYNLGRVPRWVKGLGLGTQSHWETLGNLPVKLGKRGILVIDPKLAFEQPKELSKNET